MRLRNALYGGVGGSSGATMGWLAWIALVALRQDWKEVVASVIIGAAVGFIVHVTERYIETAREESAHPINRADKQRKKHADRHRNLKRSRSAVFTSATIFLALACEHLASHVIRLVAFPFMASVVGFFVPGAILAYALWHLRYTDFGDDLRCAEDALKAGILSGLAIGLIFASMNRSISALPPVAWSSVVWSSIAWWFAFSLGLAIAYVFLGWLLHKMFKYQLSSRFHALAPVLSVPIIIMTVLAFSAPVTQKTIRAESDFWRKSTGAPIEGLPSAVQGILVSVVNQMLTSGELPEAFWKQAEEGLHPKEQKTEPGNLREGGRSFFSGTIGCHATNLDARSVATASGTTQVSENQWSESVLCQQLDQGFTSDLVRSWFVLLAFAIGLGFGHRYERELRPETYDAGTETRQADMTALAWISISIAVFIILVIFHGAI
jgi:hypothetical protein